MRQAQRMETSWVMRGTVPEVTNFKNMLEDKTIQENINAPKCMGYVQAKYFPGNKTKFLIMERLC